MEKLSYETFQPLVPLAIEQETSIWDSPYTYIGIGLALPLVIVGGYLV